MIDHLHVDGISAIFGELARRMVLQVKGFDSQATRADLEEASGQLLQGVWMHLELGFQFRLPVQQ